MKRIAGIFAVFLVAVVALVALFLALLPREALKSQIGRQISGWTGREVSLRGEPEIHFFPMLSVTLHDVEVAGPPDMPEAGVITMDSLTGTIRLAPLIIGRVEIDSFDLVRPVLHLIRDEAGHRNWVFDAGAAALQLAFSGDVPLGVFRLREGTVLFEDREHGDSERFDSVNLKLEWTSVRTPLAVQGSGIWRGEQVTVSADAKAPFAYLNGAATDFEAHVDSAPIAMVFSGQADDYPHAHLAGSLKLSTASLRRFANWLGSPIGPGTTLGQASLFGNAEFRDWTLSVADAQLTLDGNGASGALKVLAAAKPDITGTLAFDTLDLTPYFGGLSTALSDTPDWRTVMLPTDWFRQLSADIRLSANAVKLGSLAAGGTAASASLRDGRLEIGLARADFDGGSLAGDLAVTDAPAPKVAAQMRADEIDLARAGPALGLPDISGRGTVVVDLTTGGGDLGALLDGLNGTAELRIVDGAVPIFGVAALAADAGVAADPAPDEDLTPVPVETLAAKLTFSGGAATLAGGSLVTTSYTAEGEGRIGLRDGGLSVEGTIRAAHDVALPFTIRGTLARPKARRTDQAG